MSFTKIICFIITVRDHDYDYISLLKSTKNKDLKVHYVLKFNLLLFSYIFFAWLVPNKGCMSIS